MCIEIGDILEQEGIRVLEKQREVVNDVDKSLLPLEQVFHGASKRKGF